ncbi:MAG: hypothetical protein ACFHXK_05180 [bacterium]
MAHSFTGPCALFINQSFLKQAMLVALASICLQADAAPADNYELELREALAAADAAWTKSMLLPDDKNSPYDEQIFIELSPILDSPEGVKLPDDQQIVE